MYSVYCLLNPLKPGKYLYNTLAFIYEPFYIGVSKNVHNRLKQHFWASDLKYNHNILKHQIIKEIKNNKINKNDCLFILESNLTKIQCSDKEKYYINIIGRQNNTTGPLTNLSSGGELCENIYIYLKTKSEKIILFIIKNTRLKPRSKLVCQLEIHIPEKIMVTMDIIGQKKEKNHFLLLL